MKRYKALWSSETGLCIADLADGRRALCNFFFRFMAAHPDRRYLDLDYAAKVAGVGA
jgi:hypothetical protein